MDYYFILKMVFIFLLASFMFYYAFQGMYAYARGKLGKALGYALVSGLNLTVIILDILELI